jgi:D-alanine-D-alanine ligase
MGRREKILILYNEPVLPENHPDYTSEIELWDTIEAVEAVLRGDGYNVELFAGPNDPVEFLRGVQEAAPDAIVNLYEGSGEDNATELYAAGILEWLRVPYTGCPFHTLVLARSKHHAKRIFMADGLPTAPYLVAESAPVTHCPLKFPVILKPTQQDASIGITQESVASDLESLNRKLKWMLEEFAQPVLVEEFIFGRELTVALVEMPELMVLPGTEVIFPSDPPEGYWPILSYKAKWDKHSMEFNATDYHFKADLAPELLTRIHEVARRAFRLLGCRDYARVDFRIRQGDDQPFVLELNPNPDFAPNRALSNNLWAAGLTTEEFIRNLVRRALSRRGPPSAARYRQRDAG